MAIQVCFQKMEAQRYANFVLSHNQGRQKRSVFLLQTSSREEGAQKKEQEVGECLSHFQSYSNNNHYFISKMFFFPT